MRSGFCVALQDMLDDRTGQGAVHMNLQLPRLDGLENSIPDLSLEFRAEVRSLS